MDRYEWKYIDMALCLSFSAQFKDFSDVFVGFKELKFSFRMKQMEQDKTEWLDSSVQKQINNVL